MNRKMKPVKIKRYRKSFSGKTAKMLTAKRWILFVVVLAVLFAIGFFVAKPVLDKGTSWWYSRKESAQISSVPESQPSEPESQPTEPSESAVDSTSETEQEPPAEEELPQNGGWRMVDFAAVATPEAASATAKQLKSEGITHALIVLKDSDGNLYYQTNLPEAAPRVSSGKLDAAAVAQAFLAEGVRPCAYIEAFRDAGAAYDNNQWAVHYLDQEYLWLDSSRELGGKPWLNPYRDEAVDYVLHIAAEVADLGFTDVVVGSVQFPGGYSLELCGYGEGSDQRSKPQVLKNIVAQLDELGGEKGVTMWYAVPGIAASGYDLRSFGENPAGFGAKNMLLTVNYRMTEEAGFLNDAVTPEKAAEIGKMAQAAGTQQMVLCIRGAAVNQEAAQQLNEAAEAAGFIGKF